MDSKNQIVTGLSLIIIFFIFFIWSNNTDSNLFWKDRKFTVIEKNVSGHEYKGRYVGDYYITVRYLDDGSEWVENVSGNKYFSYDLNQTYLKRDLIDTKFFDRLMIVFVILCLTGTILLSWGLAKLM